MAHEALIARERPGYPLWLRSCLVRPAPCDLLSKASLVEVLDNLSMLIECEPRTRRIEFRWARPNLNSEPFGQDFGPNPRREVRSWKRMFKKRSRTRLPDLKSARRQSISDCASVKGLKPSARIRTVVVVSALEEVKMLLSKAGWKCEVRADKDQGVHFTIYRGNVQGERPYMTFQPQKPKDTSATKAKRHDSDLRGDQGIWLRAGQLYPKPNHPRCCPGQSVEVLWTAGLGT